MQTTSMPLRDIESVQKAYQWLNSNKDNNSAILAHDAFDTWTMLYLNSNHKGYLFDFNIQQAVKRAATDGYQKLYFGWWNQTIEWYQLQP
jgi:ABC-type nitrate/sulfonate/bicarbonate transport system substrate-binding protein